MLGFFFFFFLTKPFLLLLFSVLMQGRPHLRTLNTFSKPSVARYAVTSNRSHSDERHEALLLVMVLRASTPWTEVASLIMRVGHLLRLPESSASSPVDRLETGFACARIHLFKVFSSKVSAKLQDVSCMTENRPSSCNI